MKKLIRLLSISIGMLIFFACEDEDAVIQPVPAKPGKVTAEFLQTLVNVPEDAPAREFQIRFDKPATKAALLLLSVSSQNVAEFVTSPAIEDGKINIPVIAGQTEVKFSVTPVNDEVLKQDRSIEFTLLNSSDIFLAGEKKILNVTISDDESFVTANFLENSSLLEETTTSGADIVIEFSESSPASGNVEVTLSSEKLVYGTDYITEPQAINGKVALSVATGNKDVKIRVVPLNNQIIAGDATLRFSITSTSGVITKGASIEHELTYKDDDATGISRGYTVTASGWWGNWSLKRYYTYRDDGLLSKVTWQQNFAGLLAGSYTYHYNASNQLTGMTSSDLSETIYTYEDGKIVKAEKFKDGVLKQYNVYGYDDAGNVGESAVFHRQPDGSMKLSFLFVYLYFQDGNLYKQLTYIPVEDTEEYSLISTKTFEDYNNYSNPFPMVEILPNINAQKNLPGSYRIEENGEDITYRFAYEYDNLGQPVKRRVVSGTTNEVAYYQYF